MNRALAVLCLTSLTISSSYGCFTGTTSNKPLSATTKQEARKYWLKNSRKAGKNRAVASDFVPWGGNQASWSNEAILANAVSAALNDGWSLTNVQDVLVSVPVKMIPGTVPNPADVDGQPQVDRPYGDGQTNARVTFGNGWNEKRPELVATFIQFKSGPSLIRFRFHFAQAQPSKSIQIRYTTKNGIQTQSLSNGVTLVGGDLQFDWTPSGDQTPVWGTLFENKIAFIRFTGSNNWLPIDFRNVMMSGPDLVASVPEGIRNYGSGLLDPENVKVQAQQNHTNPFGVMNPDTFASDLRARRFFAIPGIHNAFYDVAGTKFDTAVGGGATTVLDPQDQGGTAPFKIAYICFDRRNSSNEATFHVPSGGGWHEIGDPAETVINSLESGSVIFGYANGMPVETIPTNGSFDHGLTDVTVIRRVPPGFGIVTGAGPTSAQEVSKNSNDRGHDSANQRNYHWFIFDQPEEVCALEWVHKCVPTATNQLGMSCN